MYWDDVREMETRRRRETKTTNHLYIRCQSDFNFLRCFSSATAASATFKCKAIQSVHVAPQKKICFRKMCAIQLSVRFVLFLRTYTPSRLGSTLCVDSTVSAFCVSNPRGESIQWERQLMHNKSSTSYLLPAAHFTDSIFTQPQPSMQAIERKARSTLDSFAKVWCITSLFLLAFCVYAWHFSSYTVSMCSQLWCYTITTGFFTPIREKKDDRTRKIICTYKRIMLSSHSLVRLLRIICNVRRWTAAQFEGVSMRQHTYIHPLSYRSEWRPMYRFSFVFAIRAHISTSPATIQSLRACVCMCFGVHCVWVEDDDVSFEISIQREFLLISSFYHSLQL